MALASTDDYPKILTRIAEEVTHFYGQGKVANYIPELAKIDPQQFGMVVRTVDGQEFAVGAADKCFFHSKYLQVIYPDIGHRNWRGRAVAAC